MDPLGFALENYDAVGQWRSVSEAGTPIDASGVLADGTKVDGPATLRQALLSRGRLRYHAYGKTAYIRIGPGTRILRQPRNPKNHARCGRE